MIQKTVTGVQVWVLTSVLGLSSVILGVFAFSMYTSFLSLEKAVNAIAGDIGIIKNEQRHQLIEASKLSSILENVKVELIMLDRRISRIENK